MMLHPNAAADWLTTKLPIFFLVRRMLNLHVQQAGGVFMTYTNTVTRPVALNFYFIMPLSNALSARSCTAADLDLPQLDVRAVLHAGEHVGLSRGLPALLGVRQRHHHRRRGQEVS
jgi:hypothetical protein